MKEKEISQSLLDSADTFLKLYNDVDKVFKGKLTNKLEQDTVTQIKDEITRASGNVSFHILSRYEARIAVLNMTLGELATERIKQANVAFRYTKWRKSSEWNPTKEKISKDNEKVLVGDIENEVVKKTFSDMMLESYVQGLADWLETLHGDVRTFLVSVAHRIKTDISDYEMTNKIGKIK